MATDDEKLVVALEARVRDFERNMQKAERLGSRTYQQLAAGSSRATRQMEQDMVRSTNRINQALASTSLSVGTFNRAFGAIGAALSVREVIRYADAWTTAKNSLAVAGVTGEEQVKVLNRLFTAAQANAAPISALADLYGKAAQASDNLGASQADLLKFSAGVATSLRVAGTSATAAAGSLTQLGQLLGQARVQAEEFNSINEGARPILMAVAAGMDKAAGSVSKLKTMVNEGEVSGRQFFEAFLKGMPKIEAMAASATQTIDQGWTKVSNALTKYIGETDESLGASQRLVAGLSSLADNFDQTADIALKFASILAGALVGRSIVGMIATLGTATTALVNFTRALVAARSAGALTAALGGLGAAAGPVGLVIGGAVVTALTMFSDTSEDATAAARTYAEALDLVKASAKAAGQEVEGAAASIDAKTANSLTGGIAEGTAAIETAKDAVTDLFDEIFRTADMSTVSPKQIKELEEIRGAFNSGTKSAEETEQALFRLANANPDFQRLAEALSPLLTTLSQASAAVDLLAGKLNAAASGPSFRDIENSSMDAYRTMKDQADEFIRDATRRAGLTKEQLSMETEIGKVRTDALKEGVTLTEKQIEAIAKANVEGDKARSASGRRRGSDAVSEYDQLTRSIETNIAAMKAEAQALFMSGKAASAIRIEQDLLNGALQKGLTVSPQMAERFRALAEEASATEEALSALRLSQDLLFERQQAGRSETEQRVYADLRAANIDIASTTGQRLANEIRITEQVLKQREEWDEMSDIIKDTLGQTLSEVFSGGIKSFDDFLDHVTKGFAQLGQSNINKFFDNLFGGGGPVGGSGSTAAKSSFFDQIGTWLDGIFTSRKVIGAQNKAIATAASQIPTRPLVSAMSTVGSSVSKVTASIGTGVEALMEAIKTVESRGNYSAIGPLVTKGAYANQRAVGAYQVMPGNIPAWTKEVLGHSVSVQEFLRDNALQDRVAFRQLSKSLEKYGSAMDAASVWFTGQPRAAANARGATDGFNSVNKYVSMVGDAGGGSQALEEAVKLGTKSGVKSGFVDLAGGSDAWAGMRQAAPGGGMGGMGGMGGLGGMLGNALGGFSMGFQSENPAMGGLGGALSGFMAGGPPGMIVGAIAGPCGGEFGKLKHRRPA